MPLYSFKCKDCRGTCDLTRRELEDDEVCGNCGGKMIRDYSNVQLRGEAAFQPHFNHAVGEYVTSQRDFETKLKLGAEKAGTEYVPLYPGDIQRPTKDDHMFEIQERTWRDKGLTGPSKTTVIPLGDFKPKESVT